MSTLTVEQHIANVRGCEECTALGVTTTANRGFWNKLCTLHFVERNRTPLTEEAYKLLNVGGEHGDHNPYFQEPQVKTELTPIERAHKLIADVRACPTCIEAGHTTQENWHDTGDMCSDHWNEWTYLLECENELVTKIMGNDKRNYNPFYIAPEAPKETTMSQELANHIKSVQECEDCDGTARKSPLWDGVWQSMCAAHRKGHNSITQNCNNNVWMEWFEKEGTRWHNPYYKPDRMATPVPSPVKMDFTEGAKIIAREYAEKKRGEEALLQQFREKREAEKVDEDRTHALWYSANQARIKISREVEIDCIKQLHYFSCTYCAPYRNLVHVKRSVENTERYFDEAQYLTQFADKHDRWRYSVRLEMILEGGRVKE